MPISSPAMHLRSALALAAALLAALAASAEVALAPLFQDNAVLQRDKPVPVWGTAGPGEKVTVTYASPGVTRTASAAASADGRWSVALDPLPAGTTPGALTIAGTNTVTLTGILVGDVWLAAGQSNMEWALGWGDANRVLNAREEIAAADYPLIRQFKVRTHIADAPSDTLRGSWSVCTPAAAREYSATAYFFARHLHRELGVPVGIVNISWGGAPIEPFLPAKALAADPAGPAVQARWEERLAAYPAKKALYDTAKAEWESARAAAKAAGLPFGQNPPYAPDGPGSMHTPSGIYNAMVHAIVPSALRGIIWYQGESNVSRAGEYHTLFPSLIRSWRELFGQGDLPFYWVQLANYNFRGADRLDWPPLREAQHAALALPATGQAVAIDIGEPGNVHPANKQEAGRRLALLALARAYGWEDVIDSGPAFVRAEFKPDAGEARIYFTNTHGGLVCGAAPAGFELAGTDRKFHPADEVVVDGDRVTLKSRAVPAPVAARYAWRNEPRAALANGAGLPAAPFRTDDWKP